MKIYSIYKATNTTNGKCYIGFCDNFENRIKRHRLNIKHRSQYFYNAIKKYGWDNFCWEVLYQSKDGEHTLKEMENYFIVENRSYVGFDDCNGYNVTLGGEGCFGYKHTKHTLERLSKIQSEKTGKLNPFYGKKHKNETIETNRKKNIETLTNLKGKKVNQYDLNGNFIATHDSVRSAARNIGVKHYNQISKCCRGMISFSYGYLWKYA